jgi:hypothetical protein
MECSALSTGIFPQFQLKDDPEDQPEENSSSKDFYLTINKLFTIFTLGSMLLWILQTSFHISGIRFF